MEEGAVDVRRECAAMRLRRPAPGRGARISPSLPPASALLLHNGEHWRRVLPVWSTGFWMGAL